MKFPKVSIWSALYGVLILYVTWRMQGFSLWKRVQTPQGFQFLPNTFASVDHPFHVSRAETLWQELGSGHALRWIGQHQGGYPVEFYPLGEAWFEVVIRAVSIDRLPPEAAHTLGVIALFLLPGAAYVALAREDGSSPSVALLALSLQVALPGGWYGGGYTELVQWGLVTNVAGATASILALPAMIAAVSRGSARAFAVASVLSAIALYSNPRSAIGLMAIGLGVFLASVLSCGSLLPRIAVQRLIVIAGVTGLLAAPLLVSLGRYGALYSFIHYSDYANFADYLTSSRDSVSTVSLGLGVAGLVAGLLRGRPGTRATAVSAALYILMTAFVAFMPGVNAIVPQLEPTRLMPLQRFLFLYLAAGLIGTVVSSLVNRFARTGARTSTGILLAISFFLIAILTRPMFDSPLDPASSMVPPVGLYPVGMSAEPQQASLQSAIRAADREAETGTAILVLGSELSWHQQLWSPLWTERPLYYDNWLWYWHPNHAGTPGYQPLAGHHYPDPEATMTREYLDRHGIGAVVLSGAFRGVANNAPFLTPTADGVYSAYLVDGPSPIVTFDQGETTFAKAGNTSIEARSSQDSHRAEVRLNWFPRWMVQNGPDARVERKVDGTMNVYKTDASSDLALVYAVQPLDWLARFMAASGIFVVSWLGLRQFWREKSGRQASTLLQGEA